MPTDYIVDVVEENGVQTLTLPADLRLETKRVSIRRDTATGALIVSTANHPDPQLGDWKAFFDFAKTVDVPEDYMADRPMNRIPEDRGIFDDER